MVSLEGIRRGIPISEEAAREKGTTTVPECADLGKPRKMELRVYFPANCPRAGWVQENDLITPPPFFFFFFTVKKHGESGALLSFNTKVGEVGKRKSGVLAPE